MMAELVKDKKRMGGLLKKMRSSFDKLMDIDTVIGVTIDQINKLTFMEDHADDEPEGEESEDDDGESEEDESEGEEAEEADSEAEETEGQAGYSGSASPWRRHRPLDGESAL
jgi:cobalamin biosynthesis protein CobT